MKSSKKTQELLWLVTVLYAASFDERRGVYVLDFAVMHLVTSALFLPTIISAINPSLHPALLTAFFKVSVTVWVAMGRPRLQLSEILRDPANVELPRDQNPNKGENPWFKVLSSAARHPDEHTTKIVRTLEFSSRVYGSTPKGFYKSNLRGTEQLDSSIFLRAAIMTLNKQDWAVKSNFRQFKWFM
uniref:Uncharacterized protein n=2 Tax=Phakopsora pachyrhizi TaxID=170000 RepID=A0A0S1MKH1_PHAPC